jgi:hypothetical protein
VAIDDELTNEGPEPSQWVDMHRPAVDTGWKCLMSAVLELAIDDLSNAKERDDALKWFDSDGRGLFAFLDICDVLDLSAAAVRERLHAGDTPHIPRRMTRRTVLHSRKRPSVGSEYLAGCGKKIVSNSTIM